MLLNQHVNENMHPNTVKEKRGKKKPSKQVS